MASLESTLRVYTPYSILERRHLRAILLKRLCIQKAVISKAMEIWTVKDGIAYTFQLRQHCGGVANDSFLVSPPKE